MRRLARKPARGPRRGCLYLPGAARHRALRRERRQRPAGARGAEVCASKSTKFPTKCCSGALPGVPRTPLSAAQRTIRENCEQGGRQGPALPPEWPEQVPRARPSAPGPPGPPLSPDPAPLSLGKYTMLGLSRAQNLPRNNLVIKLSGEMRGGAWLCQGYCLLCLSRMCLFISGVYHSVHRPLLSARCLFYVRSH